MALGSDVKSPARTLVTSCSASARLRRAAEWLAQRPTSERVLVVGATLDAASELLREVATRVPAAFGWERITFGRLAALAAGKALREQGLSPLSPLGVEAVCARLVHQLGGKGELGRFQPVWKQPGLARALARTLQELRLAAARPGGDLGRLLKAYEADLARANLADRAQVFRLAIEGDAHPLLARPALLLDVPLQTELEAQLVARLSGPVFATAPGGDERSIKNLSRALDAAVQSLDDPEDCSLARVQKYLFVEGIAPPATAGADVNILSAPGHYRALLEEAFSRAGIPVHFAQGTVRPDPAGRAFLALLACAAEGLSARRFAEYLSLGEVPEAVEGAPPPPLPRGEPASGE